MCEASLHLTADDLIKTPSKVLTLLYTEEKLSKGHGSSTAVRVVRNKFR